MDNGLATTIRGVVASDTELRALRGRSRLQAQARDAFGPSPAGVVCVWPDGHVLAA